MKLSSAIAAIALIGTPAFAADMAVRAPAHVPVYNWTGWYVGGNAGASFGNVNTDFNAPVSATFAIFNLTTNIAGSSREHPSGFIGGGQIGYNWQFSPRWVVGLEADFQGAAERRSSTVVTNLPGITSPFPFSGVTGSTNYQTKMDWFGTVRGRVGYVWGNGEVLTYATGGLAYGKIDLEGTNTLSGTVGLTTPFSITQAFGHSQIDVGWTVGLGAEGRLGNSTWTWKVEGLHVDLGTLDATGSGACFRTTVVCGINLSLTVDPLATRSHFTDNIVRVGLNYQFRTSETPSETPVLRGK